MRPTGEEILRGLQGGLLTYVLPHVEDAYAKNELMITLGMLGIAADQWDGAAQRLVDDNATLRSLAELGAQAIDDATFAAELRALAGERDASVRIGELSAANERLRAAIGRLGVAAEGSQTPALRELRGEIIAYLRAEVKSRDRSLMGPRADG